MKKLLVNFGLYVLLFSFTKSSSAQSVAINTSGNAADPSSLLDLTSSSRGLLIPRISLVSLADATTITNPATSLLVYNSNASLTSGTGYYYNNGTSGSPAWVKLVIADASGIVKTTSPSGDVIKLERFPMGEVSMNGNNTATTISAIGTFAKVEGTSAFSSGGSYQFTNDGQNNRLKYTGTSMKMFHIACTISTKSSGSNQTMKAVVYKWISATSQWVQLSSGIIQTKLGGAGDITSTAIHVMTDLSVNDFIELRVTNTGTTNSLTVTEMNLFAMGVSMGMD